MTCSIKMPVLAQRCFIGGMNVPAMKKRKGSIGNFINSKAYAARNLTPN